MNFLEVFGLRRRPQPEGVPEAPSPIRQPEHLIPGDVDTVLPQGGPPVWDGNRLKHVYRTARGFRCEECPKCQRPLTNFYVGLVYGSRHQLRQHMSPCAHICDQCSVVVLDEKWPRLSAQRSGYSYTVPVGVFSLRGPPPPVDKLEFFETYEGHDVLHILDEDGFLEDIAYKDGASLGLNARPTTHRSKEESKRRRDKRKAERAARKRNRH